MKLTPRSVVAVDPSVPFVASETTFWVPPVVPLVPPGEVEFPLDDEPEPELGNHFDLLSTTRTATTMPAMRNNAIGIPMKQQRRFFGSVGMHPRDSLNSLLILEPRGWLYGEEKPSSNGARWREEGYC